MKRHPEDAALVQRLQDLIALQIPLLEVGIRLHGERAPPSLGPLQQRLESCFNDMRSHVETKYGKKVSYRNLISSAWLKSVSDKKMKIKILIRGVKL